MKFHWNFMKKKGPLNEIKALPLGGVCLFSNHERRDEMRLLLTRSGNIALTIIITLLTLSLLCRLFPVRLGGFIVNLSEFYSYRIIGKLTDFLKLQEFSQWNQTWDHSSTFATRFFLPCSNHAYHRSSIKTCHYLLIISLNLDGVSITCKSHTHPSHSQTSRLLTSSLSLGVPNPRPTECM